MPGQRMPFAGRLQAQFAPNLPARLFLRGFKTNYRFVASPAKGRRRPVEEVTSSDVLVKGQPQGTSLHSSKPGPSHVGQNHGVLPAGVSTSKSKSIPEFKKKHSDGPKALEKLTSQTNGLRDDDEEEEGQENYSLDGDRTPDWDPWSDPEVVEALKEQEIPVLEERTSATHIIITDGFLPDADVRALRDVFDQRFADPRVIHPERFLWDYWHVPDQYTLLRTQAQVYFPEDLYGRLEDALLSYGESHLGCRAISPIWMSYYVDGCVQELHCDNPHGPFAFVLSLTKDWDQREFTGGETMILQPGVLNYWRSYDPRKGLEMQQLVTRVPAPFNRLTVFDPRFPHGVRQVHGTRDPRKGRLVLHGWFTEPAPFFQGPLDPADAEELLNEGLAPLWDAFDGISGLITGTLIVRLHISGHDGSVTRLDWLADTLVEVPNHDRAAAEALLEGRVLPRLRALVHNEVHDCLTAITFPSVPSGEDSVLTYPIIFE